LEIVSRKHQHYDLFDNEETERQMVGRSCIDFAVKILAVSPLFKPMNKPEIFVSLPAQ
jgi:hypothetical protein